MDISPELLRILQTCFIVKRQNENWVQVSTKLTPQEEICRLLNTRQPGTRENRFIELTPLGQSIYDGDLERMHLLLSHPLTDPNALCLVWAADALQEVTPLELLFLAHTPTLSETSTYEMLRALLMHPQLDLDYSSNNNYKHTAFWHPSAHPELLPNSTPSCLLQLALIYSTPSADMLRLILTHPQTFPLPPASVLEECWRLGSQYRPPNSNSSSSEVQHLLQRLCPSSSFTFSSPTGALLSEPVTSESVTSTEPLQSTTTANTAAAAAAAAAAELLDSTMWTREAYPGEWKAFNAVLHQTLQLSLSPFSSSSSSPSSLPSSPSPASVSVAVVSDVVAEYLCAPSQFFETAQDTILSEWSDAFSCGDKFLPLSLEM